MNISDVFGIGRDDAIWVHDNVRYNNVGGSKPLSCVWVSENIILLVVSVEICYSENPHKTFCNSAEHIVR
jgi:hypothetical protein